MNANKLISLEEFLDKKRDFSYLLVHLTRSDEFFSAKEILRAMLNERTLRAYNPFCIYKNDLEKPQNALLREEFKVVCFTETPIDQIDALLQTLDGRQNQPEPYGLVFKKKYIREKGGNPVFYVTKKFAKPLGQLYDTQKKLPDSEVCRLLALISVCEEGNDWHWEREWRIVGDLHFNYADIYCGLCPEDEVGCFRNSFEEVPFIDPMWRPKQLLDELVKRTPRKPIELEPDDIPF